MENNFTNDKIYRNSLYYRFFINKIRSLDNIDLVKYYDGLNCFQYFDFDISDNDIKKLININKRNKIMFRNINKESSFFNKIKEFFDVEISDEWDAPIIEIEKNGFNDYVNSKSNNFKRLIKKCENFKKKMILISSNRNNINKLLKDILIIDQNSWKYESKSDMLNLNNEQIIYLSLLKYCKIVVSYISDQPVGYSLLIHYNDKYYAAKWGATKKGREVNAGIVCLLNQIKMISTKESLYLDLWGRRNKIYDRMATNSIKRIYFNIKKNGSKKN